MLVIVESPNKIKKLQGFLGTGYEVIATKGHFRDLPRTHQGTLPEKWEPIPGKSGIITELRTALKRHCSGPRGTPKEECVILATDPDREGEAIAWHVCQVLGLDAGRVYRCRFHEITKDAVVRSIARALAKEDVLDLALVDAQRTRRLLDRRIGYSGTRHLWRRVGGGVSAGRCLIPAAILLREVVVRETAKGERVVLRGSIQTETIGEATLFKEVSPTDDAPLNPLNEIRQCFGGSVMDDGTYVIHNHLRVVSVERSSISKNPPKPLNTSTALTQLGGSPQRAMAILQGLFEKGLITYHRTDSREICEEFKGMVLGHTPSPTTSTIPSPESGGATGGSSPPPHEAIRPTHPDSTGDDITDVSERRAYKIIWEHAVGSLYAPWNGERLLISLEGGWSASAERTIGGGWLEKIHKAPAGAFPREMEILRKGDSVRFRNGILRVRQEPRGREVSETSMVRLLEHSGIGRPSTYATIIGNLTKRGLAGLRKVETKTAMEMRIDGASHPRFSWGASVSINGGGDTRRSGSDDDKGVDEGDAPDETSSPEIDKGRTGMVLTPVGEQCLRELEESAYAPFFRIPYTAEMEGVLDAIASRTRLWEEYVNEIDVAIQGAEEESRGRVLASVTPIGTSVTSTPASSDASLPSTKGSRGAFPLTELGSTPDGWVYSKGRTRYGPVVFRYRRGGGGGGGSVDGEEKREYKKVSAKQWGLLDLSKVVAMWK